MTIKFYENSHRYRMSLELDGDKDDWAPGVTTIINKTKPKNLVGWASEMVAQHSYNLWETDSLIPLMQEGRDSFVAWARALPNQQRDKAGERGTSIHAYAEQLAAGKPVDVPPHLLGPVQNAARFMDDWGYDPVLTEVPVGNRTHWYCGKLDGVGDTHRGLALIDFKTGGRVWEEAAFQACAYRHAETFSDDDGTEYPMPAVEWTLAVHLTDDGYGVFPLETGEKVWAEFQAMRLLYDAYRDAAPTRGRVGYVGLALDAPSGDAA